MAQEMIQQIEIRLFINDDGSNDIYLWDKMSDPLGERVFIWKGVFISKPYDIKSSLSLMDVLSMFATNQHARNTPVDIVRKVDNLLNKR